MAAATNQIMNYVEPTKDVVAKVQEYLEASTMFKDVRIFPYTQYDKIFKYIPDIRSFPAVLIIYTGARVEGKQRRILQFSIIVFYQDFRDQANGAAEAQDILDEVIKQVDHQIYNQALFLYLKDEPIEFEDTGLNAYKVDFQILDH